MQIHAEDHGVVIIGRAAVQIDQRLLSPKLNFAGPVIIRVKLLDPRQRFARIGHREKVRAVLSAQIERGIAEREARRSSRIVAVFPQARSGLHIQTHDRRILDIIIAVVPLSKLDDGYHFSHPEPWRFEAPYRVFRGVIAGNDGVFVHARRHTRQLNFFNRRLLRLCSSRRFRCRFRRFFRLRFRIACGAAAFGLVMLGLVELVPDLPERAFQRGCPAVISAVCFSARRKAEQNEHTDGQNHPSFSVH